MLNRHPCISARSLLRLGVLAGSLAILGGCMGSKPQPYSPNYTYLSLKGAPRPGVVRKGYDGEEAAMLVPDACITPDTAADPFYLPSGCSNNFNLQHMAARKQDLMHGREMGPAMAAPVARAAQNYIDGTVPEERRQRRSVDESTLSTQ